MLDLLLSWPAILAGAAIAIAVAWYFPPLRRPALAFLGVLAAAFVIRKSGERAGRAQKQEEWDAAERTMERQSRELAERVRRVVDDAAAGGVRNSPYDRHHRNR